MKREYLVQDQLGESRHFDSLAEALAYANKQAEQFSMIATVYVSLARYRRPPPVQQPVKVEQVDDDAQEGEA